MNHFSLEDGSDNSASFIKYFTKNHQNVIPEHNQFFNFRIRIQIPNVFCRTVFFRNSFLPSVIDEWNKLNPDITNIKSSITFRNSLLKSIKPLPNNVFDACDPHGLKLLTRFRVGLSHLREHRFNHGFNDIIDPFCPCNMEIESVSHFFLRCDFYLNQRNDLMNDLSNIDQNILQYNKIY